MIALVTDTIPHELIIQLGDAHVYVDHIEPLKIQLEREPYEFPSFKWNRGVEQVGSIDGFLISDFIVEGYKAHPKLEMKMSV